MSPTKPVAAIVGAGRLALSAGKHVLSGTVALIGEVRERIGERSGPPPPVPDPDASPDRAPDGVAVSGFPEPPGKDPGDVSRDPSPHHALNNPVVDDPDPTEWPDPYETREDPRDPADPDGEPFGEEAHPPTGGISTSEPHPSQDPEAGDRWEGPKRDKLDD